MKSTPSKLKFAKKKKASSFRLLVESIMFIVWLIFTGFVGYFMGKSPTLTKCNHFVPEKENIPDVNTVINERPNDCIYDEHRASGIGLGVAHKDDGYSYKDICRMWKCAQSPANLSEVSGQSILPTSGDLDQTKWKSIMAFEPKPFFDKYLSQYPRDMRAVQPVLVFSHRPLAKFEELSDACKVIDISIVPDTPDVCVAVTETFHDVASYHMLHADRQPDGTFSLTADHIPGGSANIIPEEIHYKAARSLLLDYFGHIKYLGELVKKCPRMSNGKVSIGYLIESVDEFELFENSLATANIQKISFSKMCIFTTSPEVLSKLVIKGLTVVSLHDNMDQIQTIGKLGDSKIEDEFRTYFLQAMLAFAVANSNNKMLWASPGSLWFDRPDNIVGKAPITESLFSFKGRKDPKGSPFFPSFDFFTVTGNERPVHLMHELILNFDLVLKWRSLDTVLGYRLSENNSRY